MTEGQKKLDRLHRLIDSYGADVKRWPDAAAEDALALMAESVEARAAMREAGALDMLLNSLPTPSPADSALFDRLMKIPARQTKSIRHGTAESSAGSSIRETLWNIFRPRLMPQAVGIVLAGLMGVVLGLSGVDRPSGAATVFDASAYMFGDPGLARDLEDID